MITINMKKITNRILVGLWLVLLMIAPSGVAVIIVLARELRTSKTAIDFYKRITSLRWQKMSERKMRRVFAHAQKLADETEDASVVCPGCGRNYRIALMHLDHIRPKNDGGSNWINNRILLCAECNRAKGENLTLGGLINHNEKNGLMHNKNRAKKALHNAKWIVNSIETQWESPDPEIQQLLK